uniref:Uncharacterized protein n=1 Tax=Craspedostauros australis TaxID=1486917 RepID=A0A7R9WPS5_9STRA|mmetsp:Transcript_15129/g.41869  ORF Transcript_15129/g.41869 Transcript_15129/m.41869 type:complete len:477 (+) Transcript_15129:305-1735(+)|eukprot:CAMPEP_0198116432 /NCGR_PEP_ID=MMETSP1442-20131203/12274_1 /TAXON_ID= /ORGANISM="Craspedostauros australis, Strain CCMP3328" /LENGTH=476 /DNA_ID=CAMNT_0043774245 /DNA_START=190 /DNA_END=1620 /DNA_ORIENTATION=-
MVASTSSFMLTTLLLSATLPIPASAANHPIARSFAIRGGSDTPCSKKGIDLESSSDFEDDSVILTEQERRLLEQSDVHNLAKKHQDEEEADDEDDISDMDAFVDAKEIEEPSDITDVSDAESFEDAQSINVTATKTPSTDDVPMQLQDGLHQTVFDDEEFEEATAAATRAVSTTDDEASSAFVDRMELADAYDEGETTTGETYATAATTTAAATTEAAKTSESEETTADVAENEDDDDDAGVESVDDATVAEDDAPANVDELQPPGGDGDDGDGDDSKDTATSTPITSTVPVPIAATTIITPIMKSALQKLRYGSNEINLMKPAAAQMLIEKQLTRPPEGLPSTCLLDEAIAAKSKRDFPKWIRRTAFVATAIVVTVVAVQDGTEITNSAQNLFQGVFGGKKQVEEEVEEEAAAVVEEPEPEFKLETHYEDHQDLVHSVKPGSKDDELEVVEDVTWLDKAITKVENAIKRFLRMEI